MSNGSQNFNPLSLGGLALGVIGGIGSLFGAHKANKQLEALLKQNPSYQANPIAGQRLGFAQSLLNARMPGAAAITQNILGNQQNQVENINRNATDSTQALALQGGIAGQTNQALTNAGLQENEDYYKRLDFLNSAQEGSIREGDKVFQDKVRSFEDTAKIKGAEIQNRQGAWNSLSNFGMAAMNYGQMGSMFGGGMFGSKGGTATNSTSTTQGLPAGMTPQEYMRLILK